MDFLAVSVVVLRDRTDRDARERAVKKRTGGTPRWKSKSSESHPTLVGGRSLGKIFCHRPRCARRIFGAPPAGRRAVPSAIISHRMKIANRPIGQPGIGELARVRHTQDTRGRVEHRTSDPAPAHAMSITLGVNITLLHAHHACPLDCPHDAWLAQTSSSLILVDVGAGFMSFMPQ
jgi:hypothetical protein